LHGKLLVPLLSNFIKSNINACSITKIISGGANGTDKLAEIFADIYNIPINVIFPKWSLYGKKAGIIRNIEIIDQSDLIFAFWDGLSKGTEFVIKHCEKLNKKIHICIINSLE